MYYSNQILIHKETGVLAQLSPPPKYAQTTFCWNTNDAYFKHRNGKRRFKDDLNNYTHVSDGFGRGVSGWETEKKWRKVNFGNPWDLLEYYAKSDKEQLTKDEYSQWKEYILKEMDTKDEVRNFYSDGDECWKMYHMFKDDMGMKYNHYVKGWDGKPRGISPYLEYNGEIWIVDNGNLIKTITI